MSERSSDHIAAAAAHAAQRLALALDAVREFAHDRSMGGLPRDIASCRNITPEAEKAIRAEWVRVDREKSNRIDGVRGLLDAAIAQGEESIRPLEAELASAAFKAGLANGYTIGSVSASSPHLALLELARMEEPRSTR